jgi:hypothetical protein
MVPRIPPPTMITRMASTIAGADERRMKPARVPPRGFPAQLPPRSFPRAASPARLL